jgi:Tfp pilus assembly protein PilF
MGGRDPKDGMALYGKLQDARQAAQDGEWDRATPLLNEVLAVAPENVTARNVLALGAVRRGDYEEAERQYQASLTSQSRQHRVLGALGTLALRRDDVAGAEAYFRRALELAPGYVEAMSNLGWIAASRGDDAGAQAWYERALALDPAYPHVHRRLADLYYDRKDWRRALDYYDRVLGALPRYFEVLIQAGNAARFAGDATAAARYYEAAGAARPDSWIPPFNLACLRAVSGESQAALAALDDAVAHGLDRTSLLDGNRDLESLRSLPGWREVRARAQAKAR